MCRAPYKLVSKAMEDAGGSPRLEGMRLEPPSLEDEFRLSTLRGDARLTAIIVAVVSVGSTVHLLNDRSFAGASGHLGALLAARLAFIVACLVCGTLVLRAKRPAQLDVPVLVWILLVEVLQFLVQATRPANYFHPVVESFSSITVVWVLVPSRFGLQAAAAAIFTVGTAGWLYAFRDPLPVELQRMFLVTFVATNGMGAFVSYRLHASRRRAFLEQRALRAAMEENAVLVGELRDALQSVKTLTGLLPICMYCKKIRDNQGSWAQLERYIATRTDASFTHGICPQCFDEHAED